MDIRKYMYNGYTLTGTCTCIDTCICVFNRACEGVTAGMSLELEGYWPDVLKHPGENTAV